MATQRVYGVGSPSSSPKSSRTGILLGVLTPAIYSRGAALDNGAQAAQGD